jgi:hypothetical protein
MAPDYGRQSKGHAPERTFCSHSAQIMRLGIGDAARSRHHWNSNSRVRRGEDVEELALVELRSPAVRPRANQMSMNSVEYEMTGCSTPACAHSRAV